MSTGSDLISLIASRQNLDDYQKKHWSGSFAEYLDIVRREPNVTRTAYQRLYDMITSKGTEEIIVNKEKLLRYKFFEDPDNVGEDAIYGLERTMINLVNVLKSACARVRHRAASVALARSGWQLEEHDCAVDQEGAGTLLAHRGGATFQLRLEGERSRR